MANKFITNAQDKLNTVKPEPFKIYYYLDGSMQYEFINEVEYFKFNLEHHRIWTGRYINEKGEVKHTMLRKMEV